MVGAVSLTDGRPARVALVGPRNVPKGAVIIVADGETEVATQPLSECLHLLSPEHIIDTICMQERVFGGSGLKPPDQL